MHLDFWRILENQYKGKDNTTLAKFQCLKVL
jgi:hypothetical protein